MTITSTTLPRIAEVRPAEAPLNIHVLWRDRIDTVVDVSAPVHIFRAYAPLRSDRLLFEQVHVGQHGTDVVWTDEIDMSTDTLGRLAHERSNSGSNITTLPSGIPSWVNKVLEQADQALKYFITMLIPTVDEFLATPWDERRALLAFLVINGTSDQCYHSRIDNTGARAARTKFNNKIRADNENLRIVGQIANATKHARQEAGKASAIRAVEVVDPRFGYNSPHMGYNLSGAWSGKTVYVEISPGCRVKGTEVAKASTLWWAEKLAYDNGGLYGSLDRFKPWTSKGNAAGCGNPTRPAARKPYFPQIAL